ncbi:MAG: fumarylacetoacetate hydrolase family protein [Chloroflexota bacterium]
MKLITYQTGDAPQIGAIVDNNVVPLDIASDMIALLQEGDEGMEKAAKAIEAADADSMVSLDDVTLLPPVTNPAKVIALGRNYAAHAAEGGSAPPDYPMLFHKTAGSLIGHGAQIVIPPVTKRVDYECELVVVIGKECYQVSEEEALGYVAGYSAGNDVSARDLQRRTTQFTAGKMLDTFGPCGPALVTADEIPDPSNLEIKTILNGEVMQHSNTKMMIFTVPFTISYISQIVKLQPGDLIYTGTPEGVGFARKPPVWLKEGDEVTIDVERVGVLTNPVVYQA